MAVYCTPQQLHDRYPGVIDTTGLAPNEWQPSIIYASAIVDAFLAARYVTPLSTGPSDAPPLAQQITIDLAVADIVDRFPGLPDWIGRLKERAVQLLTSLAAGEITLIGADGTAVTERVEDSDRIRSSTSDYVPTFGVAPSFTERIDPNRITDELSDRGIDVD